MNTCLLMIIWGTHFIALMEQLLFNINDITLLTYYLLFFLKNIFYHQLSSLSPLPPPPIHLFPSSTMLLSITMPSLCVCLFFSFLLNPSTPCNSNIWALSSCSPSMMLCSKLQASNTTFFLVSLVYFFSCSQFVFDVLLSFFFVFLMLTIQSTTFPPLQFLRHKAASE